MLVVGPESAGSNPGPACYGRGGAAPTVTDANVVLGRISAANFLGGSMTLDAPAARRAIEPIAKALDYSVEKAALAIVRIANNNMVGALHTVLTEQGLDPRDFVLVAFGGAGPPHISDLMTEASIPRGLVPNFPGQFSAFGFTMADARVDRYRTVQLNSRFFDRERAAAAMAALVAECRAELAAQGHHDVTIARSVEMRYLGQNYELEIPIEAETFTDEEIAALLDTFHSQHEARFGFRLADHMEIVNFLVTGTARTGELEFPVIADAAGPARFVSRRPVWFNDGWADTPVYARDDLKCGHAIKGPALVEENASVTVLDPDKSLIVDRYGNLMISA
jgi:N-methylhydantoinase A